MLEWEVELHVDAMGEIFKHLNRCHHLRDVVDEIHVFVAAIRSADSIQAKCCNFSELSMSMLGSCKTTGYILLEQVNLRKVLLYSSEEI
jgi:hypothetical protein